MAILILPSMPVNFLLELMMKSEITVKIEKLSYLYARVVINSALKKENECLICLDDETFTRLKKDLDLGLNCTNMDFRKLTYSDILDHQLILLYSDDNTKRILISRLTFIKDKE